MTQINCRLCGQEKSYEDLETIFGNRNYPNLPGIISHRVGLEIVEDDGLSQKICKACMEKVVSFDVFASRCVQIQSNLPNVSKETRLPISCLPLHRLFKVPIHQPVRKTTIEISAENSNFASQKKTPVSTKANVQKSTSVSPEGILEFEKPKGCSIEFIPVVFQEGTKESVKSIKCGSIQIELQDSDGNDLPSFPITTTDEQDSGENSNDDEDSDKEVTEEIPVTQITNPNPIPYNIRRAIPDVCAYCNVKMENNACLNKHIWDSHPGKELIYKCGVCDRNFQTKNGLDRHKDTHSDLPRFCCELCGKLFKSHTSFCNHKKLHDPTSYRFTCTYNKCGKVFNNKSAYTEHARIHTGEAPYPCDECTSVFRTKGQLNNHKYIHADIRNHECKICGRKFRHNSHLRVHIKRHKGEKDSKCETCGKSFVNAYDLSRHKRIHTGERPFQCHLCSRALIDSGTYKKHMKMHEDYMAVLDDEDDDIDINMNPEDEDTLNEIQIRIDPLEDDSTMDLSCSELLQIRTSALAMKESGRKTEKRDKVVNDEAAVLHSIEQTVKSTLEGKSFEYMVHKDHDYIENENMLDSTLKNPATIQPPNHENNDVT